MISPLHWRASSSASLLLWSLGAFIGSARADVVLAPLFRDHAVLQRDKPVPVWGRAQPGEKVEVSFGDQKLATSTPADGRWQITLAPRPANAVAAELIVQGNNRLVVSDVVVGEVWLCSGQSNMQMSAQGVMNAAEEKAAANFPLIRQFKTENRFAAEPQETVGGGWQPCSPASFDNFSAAAYFFARALWRDLGVPVGLVNSSYGNTPISSWRSNAAIAQEPVVRAWWKQQQAAKTPPRPHRAPSSCYNAMIAPLRPYALRGMLWYQGESDASEADTVAPIYGRQFSSLISEWRKDFSGEALPFFWVQLAGYGEPGERAWVRVREQQAVPLALPATGQATAVDVGEEKAIHAKNKQAVGARLALLALHRIYGRDVEDSGPTAVEMKAEVGAMRVRFTHAEGGLVTRGVPEKAFEVAGADKIFAPATSVEIKGDTVSVKSALVPAPIAVRYAWKAFPAVTLYNRADLPAGPFRSDAW